MDDQVSEMAGGLRASDGGRKQRSRAACEANLPARRKVERDNEIIRLRLQGLTWPTICEQTGVADRTARHVYYEWRDRQFHLVEEDPISWLNEQLGMLAVLFEDLGALRTQAEVTITDRMAAIAQQHQIVKDSIQVRQMGGLLPPGFEPHPCRVGLALPGDHAGTHLGRGQRVR